MTFFDVAADAYDQFMGRFARPLVGPFLDAVLDDWEPGADVLDVGCGSGILTEALVGRFGAARVRAVDPVSAFVAATEARCPGVDTRQAVAEDLPFPERTFGAALAQLVVHFMADPVAGLTEMARVTAPGGRVGACVWDHAGGRGAVSDFWRVVRRFDASAGEANVPGASAGDLSRLLKEAGLREVRESVLSVEVVVPTFEEWWHPFTLGVGPAGAYVNRLNEIERAGLRSALKEELVGDGDGPVVVRAAAWAGVGTV